MISTYGGVVEPMVAKGELAGNMVTGHQDRGIAERVQDLWLRGGIGTRRQWVWPNPDVAPAAIITDVTTDSADEPFEFKMVDGSQNPGLRLPWYVQKGFDEIDVQGFIAARAGLQGASLATQMRTMTLVTAVATALGPITRAQDPTSLPGIMWGWRLSASPWVFYPVAMRITPTLPASRRIAISPFARLLGVDAGPWGDVPFEIDVRLVMLSARDARSDIGP